MQICKNGASKTVRTGSEFKINNITQKAKKLPNRVVLHAKPGWGKTSFAAQIPGAIFLMVKDDGLRTLMNADQLPNDVPHFPEMADSIQEVMSAILELCVYDHVYKALVIDNITGIELIHHETTCQDKYKGDWDRFHDYGSDKAFKTAAAEWDPVLTRLDQLRDKGIGVFLIAHSKVTPYKNPSGPDYDRWQPTLSKHSWERINTWADMVLFGDFETSIDKTNPNKNDAQTKGKATGGDHRILCCQHRAAYDAKNRHGLPEEIDCGTSAAEAWLNFRTALTEGMKSINTSVTQ